MEPAVHTGRWVPPELGGKECPQHSAHWTFLVLPLVFPAGKYGLQDPRALEMLQEGNGDREEGWDPCSPHVVRQRPCGPKQCDPELSPAHLGVVRPVQDGLGAVTQLRKPWVPCLQAKNPGSCT